MGEASEDYDPFDDPKPTSGPPARLVLCDFTFVYETDGERDRRLDANYAHEDPLFDEIIECLPARATEVERLPDQPPHAGTEVVGYVLGFVAALWQLLGLPGVIQLGQKTRKWLQGRRGRSGNAGALLPVAIAYIHEEVPDSFPDPQRVQFISPCTESRYPADYQVVFLFRVYDNDGRRVYLVEVDSQGNLIQFTQRTSAMFEGKSPTPST